MSDQQGPQFIVRDIDENHDDVPVDNFIWKDGEYEVHLDTSAFGVYVFETGCNHAYSAQSGNIPEALRKMANLLEIHYKSDSARKAILRGPSRTFFRRTRP